ncbi:hypothetical protein BDBG_02104 [Blastomyces gilchristii SLH14081]|uniref:Uncharacterized protein n=1 Tax=Blastomyces gilchristii (strain SLH14081) TaxID=559298 RepID=A0A179UFJ7_BLAGS|nr:uncharacterized protein BDBG_02104 [Blastomyces gilchristii SLH14081]OAT05771.1 hypothetical protein BDBG_02104 [Blastomyces gilchristii SLH14081]
MASAGQNCIPFIVSTTLDKPDSKTRKLIRSHVMRGKNTRKSRRNRESLRNLESEDDDELACVLATPRMIASELSLFSYGVELKPYMLDLIYRAFTVVKPSTYTLQAITASGARDDLFRFSNLAQDPGMLHSMLFVAQAFYDLSLGTSYGRVATFHMTRAIVYLQQRINNRKEATKLTTMAVVTSLAIAAIMTGDIEAAQKHMDGLYLMFELRGGVGSLAEGNMIVHKAQMIDLGLAMGTGSTPRFIQGEVSWSPQIARGSTTTRFPELGTIHSQLDPKLLNIWADIREFSRAANKADETGVKMSKSLVSQFSTSIPYRLLHLQFDPLSLPELLRLCMLAYVKNLLVKIRSVGRKMASLANKLEVALRAQQFFPETSCEMAELLLWSTFVAAISIFDNFDAGWLQVLMVQTISTLGLGTWTEVRGVVKRFLWIDMIFDQPGMQVFEWISRGSLTP